MTDQPRAYALNDRVRIADIPDPAFPSIIGGIGIIIEVVLGESSELGPLFVVQIDDKGYACLATELEPFLDDTKEDQE